MEQPFDPERPDYWEEITKEFDRYEVKELKKLFHYDPTEYEPLDYEPENVKEGEPLDYEPEEE